MANSLSYDNFILHRPEFLTYNLSDPQLAAFKLWVPIISKYFDPGKAGIDEETTLYAHSLFVAHVAILTWLPDNGVIPAISFGDQASQSGSEGKISVSHSRPSYAQFIHDPYLSLSRYGSELAFLLRMNQGPSIRVI